MVSPRSSSKVASVNRFNRRADNMHPYHTPLPLAIFSINKYGIFPTNFHVYYNRTISNSQLHIQIYSYHGNAGSWCELRKVFTSDHAVFNAKSCTNSFLESFINSCMYSF